MHRITLYDADGAAISPGDDPAQPYSPRATCGKCHDYGSIRHGWHFNAARPANGGAAVDDGRPGHPWIVVDPVSGTQLPLTSRAWPGTFRPDDIGLSPWQFVLTFGRHLPGAPNLGSSGRNAAPGAIAPDSADDSRTESRSKPRRVDRWTISGDFEIDCMACHATGNDYDLSEAARQVERQNFRWAPTAALGLAVVRGDTRRLPHDWDPDAPLRPDRPDLAGPKVVYDASRFDADERVFFDISRRVAPQRCYACHTEHVRGPHAAHVIETQPDVHLAAGLSCTDCHRNGIDHDMVRGYEGEISANPLANVLTCRGCHLGDRPAQPDNAGSRAADQAAPSMLGGMLGAPHPQHRGLPALHLERLACTACHSGPWPQPFARRVQTSMAHAFGQALRDRRDDAPPTIAAPIYARDANGRIAPHRLLWPAFWGVESGGDIRPLPLETLQLAVAKLLPERAGLAAGALAGAAPGTADGELHLSHDQIARVLGGLAPLLRDGEQPVYVHEGGAYRATADGSLHSAAHPRADAYLWPLAHNVRPAAEALGARGCTDCHANDAPFFFGIAALPEPGAPGPSSAAQVSLQKDENRDAVGAGRATARRMIDYFGYDPALAAAFNWAFRVRLAFEWFAWICAALLAAVLVWHGLAALARAAGGRR